MNSTDNKDTGIFERRSAAKGSIIMREGKSGNSAFLLQSGKVRVYTGEGDNQTQLAELGAGEIFGEMSLVSDAPRTATVEALEDCNLVVITHPVLQRKLKASDPTVRALVPMLIKRLALSNNQLVHKDYDLDDLTDTIGDLYQRIQISLPAVQKQSLENTVLPKMQEFMVSVKAFRDRYQTPE